MFPGNERFRAGLYVGLGAFGKEPENCVFSRGTEGGAGYD